MKSKKILSLILSSVLLLSLFSIPASANSRAQVWYGSDANGVIVKDSDIPIVVEGERLTFDLSTLPYVRYNDVESFLAYDGKVTAEYTFYNPTDMEITATLMFPFGSRPEYSKGTSTEELGKYGAYINGEQIEATLRHTYIDRREIYGTYNPIGVSFDADRHLATLGDSYLQDDFYTKDLIVTKYSYHIVCPTDSGNFAINIDNVGSERKIVLYEGRVGGYITKTGGFEVSSINDEGDEETIYFYVFGEPLSDLPEASWYDGHFSTNPANKIDGWFSYLGSETMTLEDFVFDVLPTKEGVSEVDWYNACVVAMKDNEENIYSASAIRYLSIPLMRWFEYEITLAPGERITNTVVAPMYPEVEAWDHPYEYHYTYLLSPASCWADFGTLDIVVNTPYKMSESSIGAFEKTEGGYKLVLEGLPQDESGYLDLSFTLMGDGSTPKYQPRPDSDSTVEYASNVLDVIGAFFAGVFNAIGDFFIRIFGTIADFTKSLF